MKKHDEPIEVNQDDLNIDLSDFVSTPVPSKNRTSKAHKDVLDNYDKAMKQAQSLQAADIDSDLTIPQLKSIELILQGKTAKQICDELEITPSTLRAWKKNDDFQLAIRDTRREIIYANRQNFTRLLPIAFKRLEDVLKDEDIRAADTIRAIQVVFQGSALIGSNQDDNKSNITNNSQIIINPKFTSEAKDDKPTVIDVTPDILKKK